MSNPGAGLWIPLTPINGAVAIAGWQPPRYRIEPTGLVRLDGAIQAGAAIAANVDIFQQVLPSPSNGLLQATFTINEASDAFVYVLPTGHVQTNLGLGAGLIIPMAGWEYPTN